ncbi:hypothetical protein QFC22_002960 [Naganishia vaughanmartiniae]|uniref:Uncharacterized protein n=1 Tax=Naganishia vaughanmartiniae TaxID=1424756 RepID=A0ACC2X8X1_9TREE|nr:hypothetical protein QFC22_002960 [Naganishia vaughanmartiniae]
MPVRLRSRRRLGKVYTSVATTTKNGNAPPAKRAKVEVTSPRKRLRSQLCSQVPSEDEGGEAVEDESMSSEEDEEDHDVTMLADRTMSPLKPSTSANRLRRVRRTTRSQPQLGTKAKAGKLATSAEVAQYAASSPRKRKRTVADSDEEEMDSASDSASVYTGSGSEGYESIDGENAAPDLIAEDDEQLLRQASSAALDRLRKAELVRLWKVAGLSLDESDSESEQDESDSESEEESDIEMHLTKEQLIKGIVEARKKSAPRSYSSQSSAGRRIAKLPVASRVASATTSGGRSSVSASGETSPSADDKASNRHSDKWKARAGDGKPKFWIAVPDQGKKNAKGKQRRASHTTSVASSGNNPSAKIAKAQRSHVPKDAKKRGMVRKVSFSRTEGDESNRDSSVGHADDERVDGEKGTGDALKGLKMLTRRASQNLQNSTSLRALRSRTKDQKDTSKLASEVGGKRKQKRGRHMELDSATNATEEGDGTVEMEDADSLTEQESDDPTPRLRTDKGPAISPTPQQTNMRTRQGRQQSLYSSASSSKSLELSGRYQPSEDEESEEEEMTQSGSSPVGGRLRIRHRTRGQARQQELETQLQGMDITDEEDAGDEDADQDMQDVDSNTDHQSKSSAEDEDEEGDGDDEAEEFEHGLTDATHTTLSRLRKDRLIKMCEARDLDTEGTKKDLIQYLLEWRDAESRDLVSESSSSASTAKQGSSTSEAAPAVPSAPKPKPIVVPPLLQNHSTVADPDTPPISGEDHKDSNEPGVELDLEDLGLVDKEIPAAQIQKGERIGSGGFKDVYIGKLRGRMKVAICEFRDQLSEMDIRELKLLSELNHPNIVRLLGVSVPDPTAHVKCMVITELCEKGDLFDYIRSVGSPTFAKILGMMIDIASGLEYLHERTPKVIHRDCKSSNILINKRGVCKVGDFGLARVKTSTRSVIRSLVGTINWQAPELWHPKPRYDYKVDVFSCAMVYWEMLSGWASDKKEYPWIDRNQFWIIDAVGTKKMRPSTTAIRKRWGSEVVQLLDRMWQHDPAERPTMTDVKDDLQALLAEHKRNPKV